LKHSKCLSTSFPEKVQWKTNGKKIAFAVLQVPGALETGSHLVDDENDDPDSGFAFQPITAVGPLGENCDTTLLQATDTCADSAPFQAVFRRIDLRPGVCRSRPSLAPTVAPSQPSVAPSGFLWSPTLAPSTQPTKVQGAPSMMPTAASSLTADAHEEDSGELVKEKIL